MIVVAIEVLALLVLVAINGWLAASEIALVSSRRARLRAMAEEGTPGARAALELLESPNEFLSSVQVGITVIGVLSGALGGAALGDSVGGFLSAWMDPRVALVLGIALSVAGITYLNVVVGELVPKRHALSSPERMACAVAPGMRVLARVSRPLVLLLSASMEAILRRLPVRRAPEPAVTEEEVRTILAEATAAGVLERGEHEIVQRLFHLGDRTAASLMTPRERILWLDLDRPVNEQLQGSGMLAHARFIACDGELDRVRGYVSTPDLLSQMLETGATDVENILRKPHFVRPWDTALEVLELFQRSRDHIALVVGTRGRVEGVLTLNDVLEGIVGDLPEPLPSPTPEAVLRDDGSWLVDGLLPFEDFLGIVGRPAGPDEPYATLHAFMVDQLPGEPRAGSVLRWNGVRLEVVDMDWSRVDKVLVKPPATRAPAAHPATDPDARSG
ncbi:MAG TPA: hemolysin family protein [Longimicrobiales bacterium]|nr:hemolysin family protein [Longimicrobiales bacterium]